MKSMENVTKESGRSNFGIGQHV